MHRGALIASNRTLRRYRRSVLGFAAVAFAGCALLVACHATIGADDASVHDPAPCDAPAACCALAAIAIAVAFRRIRTCAPLATDDLRAGSTVGRVLQARMPLAALRPKEPPGLARLCCWQT